ncbi:MAG TPA: hypothetical protein VGC55_13655 [Dokdonella sp.]
MIANDRGLQVPQGLSLGQVLCIIAACAAFIAAGLAMSPIS